jgi:hypothetical protein
MMKRKDVETLTDTFARLGPNGWEIPVWLATLRAQFNLKTMPSFWVIDWSKR